MSAIELTMDPEHALHMDRDDHEKVGHLTGLSVGSTVTLKADLKLVTPLDFSSTTVVGAISSVKWDGAPKDKLTLMALVSTPNRQSVMNLVHQNVTDPTVTLKFAVFDYDNVELKFFKTLHTNDSNINGSVKAGEDQHQVKIDISVATEPAKHKDSNGYLSPQLWEVTITVTPGSTEQEIHFCTGALHKLVKKWGVKTQ